MRHLACLLLATASLLAQQGQELPADVTIGVQFASGRAEFRAGEPILVKIVASAATPGRFSAADLAWPPAESVRVDSGPPAGDPLKDDVAPNGRDGSWGFRGGHQPGGEPFETTFELNELVRFPRAGEYRVTVTTSRITLSTQPGAPAPRFYAGSLAFKILPADPEEDAREVARLSGILDGNGDILAKRAAARHLSYLTTPLAIAEAMRRLGDSDFDRVDEWKRCLFGAPDRRSVLDRMAAFLAQPDSPVNPTFVRTLASLRVASRAQLPEAKKEGDLPVRELYNRSLTEAAAELASALPRKTGVGQAAAVSTLIALRYSKSGDLIPALAASFVLLSPAQISEALEGTRGWPQRAMLAPALVSLLESPPSEKEPPQFRNLVMSHLREIDPEQGGRVTVQQIADPASTVDPGVLSTLPDETLPQFDGAFLQRLKAGDGKSRERTAGLIARYATAAISGEVRAFYDENVAGLPCRGQAGLLAYFVRVDEKVGLELTETALARKTDSNCYPFLFGDIGGMRWTPGFEKLVIAHLSDEPRVAGGAAKTLSVQGSPEAEAALWKSFEGWSREWKDRAAELDRASVSGGPLRDQFSFENQLVSSLMHGRSWQMNSSRARRLSALCVTEQCRGLVAPLQ